MNFIKQIKLVGIISICLLAFPLHSFGATVTTGANPLIETQNQVTNVKIDSSANISTKSEDSIIKLPSVINEPVVDLSGTLSGSQKESLSKYLRTFHEKHNKADFVVLFVNGTNNEDIEGYTNKTFRKWGLGTSKQNNGILLVVDVKNRAYRTEVGYGLEGTLNDGYLGRAAREILVPAFQKGDFYSGVMNYAVTISGKLSGEADNLTQSSEWTTVDTLIAIGVIVVLIVLTFIFGIDFIFILLRIILLILSGGKIGGGGDSGGGGSSGKF